MRHPEELCAFEPEWAALVEAQTNTTPFQHPLWLRTWWSHLGSGELRVFAVHDDHNALAAVLPCFLHPWNGRRQLTLVGSGVSDYLDPVIAPGCEQAALDAIDAHLRTDGDWDVCDWQDLARPTPLMRMAGTRIDEETPCSETQLSGSFAQFWALRSHQIQRNVRRYRAKAREAGSQFQVIRTADPDLLETLITLHGARWQARGESGMIEANRMANFLRDVSGRAADNHMLRIFTLRIGDAMAAILLGFVSGKTLYSYLSAFDPKHAQLHPGLLLLADSFEWCFGQALQRWNFCRGDEPYKALWGAEPLARGRIRIERSNP